MTVPANEVPRKHSDKVASAAQFTEKIKADLAAKNYNPSRDMLMAQGSIEKPHPMIAERATVLEQQAKTLSAFKKTMQQEMKNRAE